MARSIPKTAGNLSRLIDIANIDLPMNIEANLARLTNGGISAGGFSDFLGSKPGINRSWMGITKQINSSNMVASARRMSGGGFFQAEGNRLLSTGINVADELSLSEANLRRVTAQIRSSMSSRSPNSLGKLGGQIDQLEIMREKHAQLLAAKSIQSNMLGPSEMTATSQEIKDKVLARKQFAGMGMFGLANAIRGRESTKEGLETDLAKHNLNTPEGLKLAQADQDKIRTIDKELKVLQKSLEDSTKEIKQWTGSLKDAGKIFSELGKAMYSYGVDIPTSTMQTKAAIGGVYNSRFSDYMALTKGPDAGAMLRLGHHDAAISTARSATNWAKGSAVAGGISGLIGTGLTLAGGIITAGSLGTLSPLGIGLMGAGAAMSGVNDVLGMFKGWTVGGGQAGVNRYQASMNEYMAGQEQQRVLSQQKFDIMTGSVSNMTSKGALGGMDLGILDSKSTTMRGGTEQIVRDQIKKTKEPWRYTTLQDTELNSVTKKVAIGGQVFNQTDTTVDKYWKAVETSPGYNSYLNLQEQFEAGGDYLLATGRKGKGGTALRWANRMKEAGFSGSQVASWQQTLGTTGRDNSIDSLVGNRSDISSYMVSGMVGLRSGIAGVASSYGMDIGNTANSMARGAYSEGSNYFKFTEAKAAYGFYDQRREQGKGGLDIPQALAQLEMTSLLGVRGAAAMSDLSLGEAKNLIRKGKKSSLWTKGFGTEGYDFDKVISAANLRINSLDKTPGGMVTGDESFTTRRMQHMAPKEITDLALKEGKEGKTVMNMTPQEFEDAVKKANIAAMNLTYLNTEQKGDLASQLKIWGDFMSNTAKTMGAEISKQIQDGMKGMEFTGSSFSQNTFLDGK